MSTNWPDPLADSTTKGEPKPLRIVKVGDGWGTEEVVDRHQKTKMPDFITAAGKRLIEPSSKKVAKREITMDGDVEVEEVYDPRIAQLDTMQREAWGKARATVESMHASTPSRDK